jgi:hypothetical protein
MYSMKSSRRRLRLSWKLSVIQEKSDIMDIVYCVLCCDKYVYLRVGNVGLNVCVVARTEYYSNVVVLL